MVFPYRFYSLLLCNPDQCLTICPALWMPVITSFPPSLSSLPSPTSDHLSCPHISDPKEKCFKQRRHFCLAIACVRTRITHLSHTFCTLDTFSHTPRPSFIDTQGHKHVLWSIGRWFILFHSHLHTRDANTGSSLHRHMYICFLYSNGDKGTHSQALGYQNETGNVAAVGRHPWVSENR